jgi:hypothetical protein
MSYIVPMMNGPKRLVQYLSRLPSQVDANLFVIILLPLIVLLFDSNVFFAVPGTIDPWVYHGFFRHLGEFKSFLFPNTYYGSRMSWIVPGYLVNLIFPPLAANYILHLGVYYTGAISLYYVLKSFYTRPTALLGVIAFTCDPYLWGAMGWDYVDGIGIAFYLLAFAIVTHAGTTGRHSRVGLTLAGATYAALIYTNTVWLLSAPMFLLFYLFLRRPGDMFGITKAAIHFGTWFAIGGAALTVALGVINYRIDGQFWFYLPSISYTLQNANKPQPWHAANYSWVGTAHWLVYPAIMLLVASFSLVASLFKGKRDTPRTTWFFRLHFLFFVVVFVLLELKGLYLLEWGFYASYLIPATFLLASAELFDIAGQSKPKLIALLAGCALFLAWSGAGDLLWTALLNMHVPLVLGIATCAILLRAVLPANRLALAACLIGFSLLNFYASGMNGLYAERDQRLYRSDAFLRMTETVDAIDQARRGSRVLFWFDTKDPHSDEFDSINSFFLWGYTWIGRAFPEIDPVASERVTPGSMVAVLSSHGDQAKILEEANRALKPRGFAVSWRTRREINYGGVHYAVICLDLVRDSD